MNSTRLSNWFAFWGVVLIWSTTPLAIIYSSQELDPFLSLSLRFALSLLVLAVWYWFSGRRLPWHRDAIKTYIAVGVIGVGLSMSCSYLAAQTLPSAWMALIFGLTPVFAGILEGLVFKSLTLNYMHWLGMGLSLFGLGVVMFQPALTIAEMLSIGAMLMLLATALHALSASLMKRIKIKLDIWDTVLGGLIFALPLTLVFWLLSGAIIPTELHAMSIWSIFYLGIIGSLAGFLLYYKTLSAFSATTSSFITLLAPPFALLWAVTINHEPMTPTLFIGTGLVLIGLWVFIRYGAERTTTHLNSRGT